MRKPVDNDFASRRVAAVQAKAAQLEAHLAAMKAAEPTRMEREEERREIAVARDLRQAERDQAKLEARDRVRDEALKEKAATEAAAKAEVDASETALNARVSRVIEDEATRKAERDRRYANRKAKK